MTDVHHRSAADLVAMLAAGDALAVVLLEHNRFSPQDFRRLHPGGLLGRRLASQVKDLRARSSQDVPLADNARQVIDAIDQLIATQVPVTKSPREVRNP